MTKDKQQTTEVQEIIMTSDDSAARHERAIDLNDSIVDGRGDT